MNPYKQAQQRANKICRVCEKIQIEHRKKFGGNDEQLDIICNLARAYRFDEAIELLNSYYYGSNKDLMTRYFKKRYVLGLIEGKGK